MKRNKRALETELIHTPFPRRDGYNALSMPIYNAVAYEFGTAQEMEDAFVGRTADPAYSRISNPTVQYFEERVKRMTGAFDVMAVNSGMAAVSSALMTVAYAGANIVTSSHLFGNTYSFLKSTLSDFGVEVRFCDLTSLEEVEKVTDKNTCALFLEVITNPQLEVADLTTLSAVCRRKGIPLIADTTVVPFQVFKAAEFGVDIEIVSSTKYISGGATSLGGLVVDYGSFDWDVSPKLKPLIGPFGKQAFSTKMRREMIRNLGVYMTPQVAYMQTLGLETLQLRFDRASRSCLELLQLLKAIPQVVAVNYTGLRDNPFYAVSRAQFGDYPGAMFTFDLASREACFSFMDRLKLIKRATNLFDNKTLAIHPASTIFGSFSPEVKRSMDISENTIRISVGLEQVSDLYEDILQALS